VIRSRRIADGYVGQVVTNLEEVPVGKFFSALKRGYQAMGDTPDGERYTVAGRAVSCVHCANDRFVEGRAQLNTAGMSFVNLDWANRSAATLTCTACGRIEWFLADPEEAG
jgi:hypothetical protein